jgi:hypothetical protein
VAGGTGVEAAGGDVVAGVGSGTGATGVGISARGGTGLVAGVAVVPARAVGTVAGDGSTTFVLVMIWMIRGF